MAREVVCVHVGGCGLTLGRCLWRGISEEHGLQPGGRPADGASEEQLKKMDVFFQEAGDGSYQPRAVLVDVRPDGEWRSKFLKNNRVFPADSLVAYDGDVFNNWGKGFMETQTTVKPLVMDAVRKAAERCDSLQGFQLSHSVCGGTGGGLGSLLLQEMAEEFPKNLLSTVSVMSSPTVAGVATEAYNTTLSYSKLVQHADFTFLVDDSHLRSVCVTSAKAAHARLSDVNRTLSAAMSDVTSPWRFPNQHCGDLWETAKNLVPMPSLLFLNVALAPVSGNMDADARPSTSVNDLAVALFNPRAQVSKCHPRGGRFLSLSCHFRGPFPLGDAEEHVAQLTKENHAYFAPFLPTCANTSVCGVPRARAPKSAVFLSNHTAMRAVLLGGLQYFQASFSKRHGLDAYQSAGLEEQDFLQAREAVENVIGEYQRWETY